MPYHFTPHFTLDELVSTSTPGGVTENLRTLTYDHSCNLRNLAAFLENLRTLVGEPIIVNSAFRCPRVNNSVGGVSNSNHLKGLAADIRCGNLSELYRICYFLKNQGFISELIRYSTFIHISIYKNYNYENGLPNHQNRM